MALMCSSGLTAPFITLDDPHNVCLDGRLRPICGRYISHVFICPNYIPCFKLGDPLKVCLDGGARDDLALGGANPRMGAMFGKAGLGKGST